MHKYNIKHISSVLSIGIFAAEHKIKFYVRIIQLCIVLSIFLLIFWILPAAIMTRTEEDWDLITAVYFCFITITTIGLGTIFL